MLSIIFYIDKYQTMCHDPPVDRSTSRGTTVMLHAQILSDVIRRERALEATPARQEHRRMVHLAEALRCCTGLVSRLRAAVGLPGGQRVTC